MRYRILTAVLAVVALMVMASQPAVAQVGFTKVQGTVIDENSQPISGAVIDMYSAETGAKYSLKSDSKGRFFSLGIQPGSFKITVVKDGKTLWTLENFVIRLTIDDSPNTINFDLAKQKKEEAVAGKPVMTEEQKKELERVTKENSKVKNLNQLLLQAQTELDAGNFNAAIGTFTQAANSDPGRDLLWVRLADANLTAGKKSTDREAGKEKYAAAAAAYQKGIEIAEAPVVEGAPPKNANKPETLAAYYNNMAEALAKGGNVDGGVKAYQKAADLDPTNGGKYYFNMGAILTNAFRTDEAIVAYDKAIAADPEKVEAYYYKGTSLLAKATMKGDTVVAPPGTAEMFNKVLELQPEGALAEQSKQMLAAIGAKVETSFGTKKKPAPIKK